MVRCQACIPTSPGHDRRRRAVNEAARVADGLRGIGLEPVLVGGMALVLLGSRRITRDFDFVIRQPGDRLNALVDLFYDRGFELRSKTNDAGDVVATIDNRRVAGVRLKLDAPASAFFWHSTKRLRIDLLFDSPSPRPSSPPTPSRPGSVAAF